MSQALRLYVTQELIKGQAAVLQSALTQNPSMLPIAMVRYLSFRNFVSYILPIRRNEMHSHRDFNQGLINSKPG